jgi:DtxR family transcriptional regulator, manganese transport regulator|tara:strand:+ start:1328 stop:1762 length:435 start_codon:yes stop_codon:yes gene_type:complete
VNKPQPDITQSDRFESTRAAHRDETAEDYAEAIAQLIEQTGTARVGDLANCMGVSHVTVTRIINRLAKEGLLTKEPRKPIFLTEAGQSLADQCRERHEIVLAFLLAIGVEESQAQIDAEGIEHHTSHQTLAALAELTRSLKNRK